MTPIRIPQDRNYFHTLIEFLPSLYRQLEAQNALRSKSCSIYYSGPYRDVFRNYSNHILPEIEAPLDCILLKKTSGVGEMIGMAAELKKMVLPLLHEVNEKPSVITLIVRKGFRRLPQTGQILDTIRKACGPNQELLAVDLSDMAFRDQVKLARRTKLLIGTHGAGLSNLIFMHPGSRVCEIYPFKFNLGIFQQLSRIYEIKHQIFRGIDPLYYVTGNPPKVVDNRFLTHGIIRDQPEVTIDLHEFEKMVVDILKETTQIKKYPQEGSSPVRATLTTDLSSTHEYCVLFGYVKDDEVTLKNLSLLKQYNDVPVIPLFCDDGKSYPQIPNAIKVACTFRGTTKENLDLMIKEWFLSPHRVSAKRYFFIEGDCCVNVSLKEWYKSVWNHDVVGSRVMIPGINTDVEGLRTHEQLPGEEWSWFVRQKHHLPQDIRQGARGIVPLNGLMLSFNALNYFANSPTVSGIMCELRLPSVLKAGGFEIHGIEKEKGYKNVWKREKRLRNVLHEPGVWHPVKQN